MRYAVMMMVLLAHAFVLAADPRLSIFDAHIHYSADVWEPLPPARALDKLTQAGIVRAVVSSTPTEGTERLYRLAPGRIVPFLRPYATPADRQTWYWDPALPDYVRGQLERIPYRGIGEFHVFGDDARTPVVGAVVTLARERGLVLHAHTDLGGLQAIMEQGPDIPVIWAHTGFDVPVTTLRALLEAHANLFLELSFREGITADGVLTSDWRALFGTHPRRFLVGMDTYVPSRWAELPELAEQARQWLNQLPAEVAADIAHGNATRLFATGRVVGAAQVAE